MSGAGQAMAKAASRKRHRLCCAVLCCAVIPSSRIDRPLPCTITSSLENAVDYYCLHVPVYYDLAHVTGHWAGRSDRSYEQNLEVKKSEAAGHLLCSSMT